MSLGWPPQEITARSAGSLEGHGIEAVHQVAGGKVGLFHVAAEDLEDLLFGREDRVEQKVVAHHPRRLEDRLVDRVSFQHAGFRQRVLAAHPLPG